MKSCHRCGHAWSVQEQPGFNNTCEGCGTPVHSCANCEHHRREGRLRCDEPKAPRIFDAAAANDCSYFRFRVRGLEPEAGEQIANLRKHLLDDRQRDQPAAEPQLRWEQLFDD